MKIKTSELQGAALDWAVAKCEDKQVKGLDWVQPAYSTDWAQGGPIIEKEKMAVLKSGREWAAQIAGGWMYYGPTPLIAAMRCYVASKLGDEVEIPEGLV